MPAGRPDARTPYALVLTVCWPDGAATRHVVGRRRDHIKAMVEANRGNRAWSQLIGGWHWPPTFTVVDTRDGTEYHPTKSTGGNPHHATQATGEGPGRLF